MKKRVQRKKQKKFIDILLQKYDDQYNKIGILHTIGKNDLYADDKKIEKSKMDREIESIRSIVNENLKYIRKDEINFQFAKSYAELKVSANELISVLQNQIDTTFNIADECNEIKSYFEREKKFDLSDRITGATIYTFHSPLKWRFAKQIYKMNTLYVY